MLNLAGEEMELQGVLEKVQSWTRTKDWFCAIQTSSEVLFMTLSQLCPELPSAPCNSDVQVVYEALPPTIQKPTDFSDLYSNWAFSRVPQRKFGAKIWGEQLFRRSSSASGG